MAMQVINPGVREFGQTSLGSDFNNQKMYKQYVDLYNHFNEIGQPELADQLTLNMEQQYAVKGGTQPMLDNFEDIANGGLGGYDANQLASLSGGVPLVTKQELATQATNYTGAGEEAATGIKQLSDPNKDNVQKGLGVAKSTLGTLGALGVGGAAVPVLGAGLAVGGAIYDYNKQRDAEIGMQDALDREEQIRNIASAKYNKELDNEYARRELGLRGQTQASPLYTAMMAQSGKQYANQNQVTADTLEKGGMSEKSGMSGQLASQNFNNLSKNISKATKDTLSGQPRAYGGLQGLATSTRPEQNQYVMNSGMYNEYKDFGSNLAPIGDMAQAYGKYKARKAGLQGLYNDYEENKKGGV